MLYPHNLFEILRNLDRIDKIQKYSILTNSEGKKQLVESIGVIRTLITEELNTQKAQIMGQIQEHNDNANRKPDGT